MIMSRITTLLLGCWIATLSSVFGVNNDGKTDIYWRNYATGDDSAWTMNGSSYVSTMTLAYQANTNWVLVATGDFNNDGDLDLLWRNSTNGMNAVWFLMGGTYRSSAVLQPLTDTNWEVAGTGYFGGAGDKNIDILWRNKSTGDNAIWFLNGTAVLATALIQEVPDLGWKIGGTGDFNNDGYTDIVWRNATTGANAVWYMQGASYISSAVLQSETDGNWQIVGTGYFTGLYDNTLDLLWRNKSTGDSAVWALTNAVTLVSSTLLPWVALPWRVGGTGDSKVDTDNDGLPDLWEFRFFGNLVQTASADPDGDSQNNLTEYQNGSDPTVSNTAPNLGNAVDNNLLIWTGGGNAPWSYYTNVYFYGVASAKSGSIGASQTTWMETTVIGPGTFSFYWKVSSQSGDSFDFTKFYPDGSGSGWGSSGDSSWEQYSGSLASGTNTLRFTYSKDGGGEANADSAYVDRFQITYSGNNSNATNNLSEAVDDFGRNYITDFWEPWDRTTLVSQYGFWGEAGGFSAKSGLCGG